ncbi:hypothetical protein [Rhodoferax sp.]
MPATELVVKSLGTVGDKQLLVPTGKEGSSFAHVQDWLTAKRKAKTAVKDISSLVLVKGIKQWAVYQEKSGSKTVLTVFRIT